MRLVQPQLKSHMFVALHYDLFTVAGKLYYHIRTRFSKTYSILWQMVATQNTLAKACKTARMML